MAVPNSSDRCCISPSRNICITSRPIAMASGFPPKVDPCSPGCNTANTSSRDTTADTGMMPPPSAFPSSTTSGTTPSQSHARVRPVRPSPDWISSAMNRTLASLQAAAAAVR